MTLTHFWELNGPGPPFHMISVWIDKGPSGAIAQGEVIDISDEPYLVERVEAKTTGDNTSLHVFVREHRSDSEEKYVLVVRPEGSQVERVPTPTPAPAPNAIPNPASKPKQTSKPSKENPMVRRKSPTPHIDHDSSPRTRSGGSIDPDGPQAEKGSAIYRMKLLIENLFSYRGIFWIGVGIAVVAFIGNAWFYFGLFTNTAGLGFFMAILAALFVSFGTSLFQLMPKLQTATARMSLHQIFVAGSKPNAVPELDERVVADSKNLIADYRDAELKRRAFFKMARNISFLVEGFLGVMFIGNIGAGGGALFSLIGFALSVWGVEAGVTLALKAGEDELPPQIKEQLEGLLRNDGQNLRLRGL